MTPESLPTSTSETEPFWAGLKEGELRLPRCEACGLAHFYPRPLCPYCGSNRIAWVAASGEGTVYSHTTIHRAPSPAFEGDVPYVVAVIRLAEGPHMMSRLVDADPDSVHVEAPVRMRLQPVGDGALPVFALAAP